MGSIQQEPLKRKGQLELDDVWIRNKIDFWYTLKFR